jgi:hypothetical protein
VPAAPGAGGSGAEASSSFDADSARRPVSASIARRNTPRSSGGITISMPASGVVGGGPTGSERTPRCIRGRGGDAGEGGGCLRRSTIRTGAGRSPGAAGSGAASGTEGRMIEGGSGDRGVGGAG